MEDEKDLNLDNSDDKELDLNDAGTIETEQQEIAESDKEQADEPQKAVPVSKYRDERKKRQAIEAERDLLKSQLAEMESKGKNDSEVETYRNSKRKELIDSGLDEAYADVFSKQLAELKKETLSPKKAEPVVDKYSIEINKLKTTDDYYDNADAYADKIKEKMEKLNVTAEEAYNMIVKPTARYKELQQRKLAEGTQSKEPGNLNSSSSKPTGDGGLPESEMAALRMYNKLFPDEKKTVAQWKETFK